MSLQLIPSVVLLAAILGCGGASDATVTDPTANNTANATCSIALSGGRSGSLTCSGLAALRNDSDGNTQFGFKGVDATDTLTVVVGFSGAPVARTYVSGTDASPSLLLFGASTLWTTAPAVGTLSLAITSVKTIRSGAGLTSYEVHGTLAATMIAAVSNGSVAPVTVSATF